MKTKPIQLLLLFSLSAMIFSCEKDDSIGNEQNYLKTVALSEAKDFLRQSQEQSKSNPVGSFITSLSDEISYEDLTNTDEQVAVIPVTTQYSKLNSRLVLLTIHGKVESAVVSLNPFEDSTVNNFSGELLITDTDGRFIKAFKIENNVYMAEYVNNNSKSNHSSTQEKHISPKDTSGSCRCVFSVCDYCQLEEVVIVVESTPPRIPAPYVSITHMYNTGGGGDEATGNEWDLGGSGSGYTDYSPDPEPETPCDKINSLESDSAFKNKLEELEQNTNLDYETGFLLNHNGAAFDPIAGVSGADEINFNVSGTIDGFLHSHVLPNGNSIFSPDDIRALYILFDGGYVNNPSTFVMSVVTGHGTSYTIMIDDENAFNNFGQNNLNNLTNFTSFSNYYNNNYLTNTSPLVGLDDIAAREVAMLIALENSGLSLLKGNSDYSDWQKIKAQERESVNVDCN